MHSTRSLVHQWKKTGEFKAQELTKMTQNMAKAAKWLKAGGYIGTALSGMDTALQIDKACSTGREAECTKASIVDTSSFVVGAGVSFASVEWGARLAIALLLAPETGGLSLAIVGIIGAGAAAYGVGKIAPKAGEKLGEGIYYLKTKLGI